MIVIAGSIKINLETHEEAIAVALDVVSATQAETGCISYNIYASLNDPDTFFIFEEWENEEALAQHFQTEYMAAFQKELPRFLAGPPEIKRYDVASVGDL